MCIRDSSGAHLLATGTASLGDSGALRLGSDSARGGSGGFCVASVGVGDSGNGGSAAVRAPFYANAPQGIVEVRCK